MNELFVLYPSQTCHCEQCGSYVPSFNLEVFVNGNIIAFCYCDNCELEFRSYSNAVKKFESKKIDWLKYGF